MSDIPRTDKGAFTITEYSENRYASSPSERTNEVVLADDARKLERELNVERDKVKDLRDALEFCIDKWEFAEEHPWLREVLDETEPEEALGETSEKVQTEA